MSIFDTGSAIRIWAARHGLAPTAAASQVADIDVGHELIGGVEQMFEELDAPVIRAINSRKVHAVAANETEGRILVYLSKGFTKKQEEKLPKEFDGYSIEYRQGVIGQVGGMPPAGLGAPSHYLHNNRITCGSSIGLGGSIGAGTLGALVSVNGELFGLSNNHVIGRCSYAENGHPVLTPGNLDINPNFLVHPFTAGVYETCSPLAFGSPGVVDVTQNLDAALMRIVYPDKVSSMQGNEYDTPTVVAALADGMEVQKVGRTTGLTFGTVTGKIAGFQPVAYVVPELQQQFSVYFSEAWIVEGTGGPAFSDNGDSGSLVVTTLANGNTAAVGLVFAGNGSISLIVPLDAVLANLGATLIGAHGI